MNLINGDCVTELSKLNDESFDLTITSPPYDNLRSYNDSLVWGEVTWKKVIEQIYRVTKDGGAVVWIVNDATIGGDETGSSFRQALYFKEVGFKLHDTMIWEKNGFTATGSLQVRYASTFEYMFVISKNKMKTFNPIYDRKNVSKGYKKFSPVRQIDGSFKEKTTKGYTPDEYGQRFNIWGGYTLDGEHDNHPAAFPVSLIMDHIISWSNAGDEILDPFMGSGTTGVACKRLERGFTGIEKDESYFKNASIRIENALPDNQRKLLELRDMKKRIRKLKEMME